MTAGTAVFWIGTGLLILGGFLVPFGNHLKEKASGRKHASDRQEDIQRIQVLQNDLGKANETLDGTKDSLADANERLKIADVKLDIANKKLSEVERQVGQVRLENQKLIEGNDRLLEQNRVYQDELKEKQKQIDEIEMKADDAKAGKTEFLRFDGSMMVTESPGQFNLVIETREHRAYLKIGELNDVRNDPELVVLCESLVKEFPDWSTPCYWLGVAYINSNKQANAIVMLERFIREAPDDPEYSKRKTDAKGWVAKLRESPK